MRGGQSRRPYLRIALIALDVAVAIVCGVRFAQTVEPTALAASFAWLVLACSHLAETGRRR